MSFKKLSRVDSVPKGFFVVNCLCQDGCLYLLGSINKGVCLVLDICLKAGSDESVQKESFY